MKISKEVGDNKISVYSPDEKEKEVMNEVANKIIDLIISYELSEDQEIHLISSLYESMKNMHDIKGMKHFDGLEESGK